jgi:lysophospholipase L1-like esterase
VELYQPDVILVSFGWNDAAEVGGAHSDRDYQQPSAWRIRVLRVLLKSRLFLVLMQYLPKANAAQPLQHTARVSLSDYLHNMTAFAEISSKRGASVVFLTRPHREKEAKLRLAPPQPWKGQIPEYNSRLRLWAKEHRLPLINVQATFESAGAEFFLDESHFTPAGDRRMAETLITELASSDLVRGVTP